jgi:hypothetical protein
VEEWQQLLDNGKLATPRDRIPTPPNTSKGQIIYGRVAGVAQGFGMAHRTRRYPSSRFLSIPEAGLAFSYGLATLQGGLMGTDQSQSATMLVRYNDTAYFAHGNYGINIASPCL